MKTSTQTSHISRYSGSLIALHWLMLVLFIGIYVCIEAAEMVPEHSPTHELLMSWHYQFGFAILALVWLRLLMRLVHGAPAIEPAPPDWQRRIAAIMHMMLYGLMIIMPITGWLLINTEGEPLYILGVNMPVLLSPHHGLAELFEEVHEIIGLAGYAFIGLHTLAALFHHYILGDNTLKRMLPRHNRP